MNGPAELTVAAIRTISLLVPLALTGALWLWRRPDRRLSAGLLLSLVWNLTALLAVQIVAIEAGWWAYRGEGGMAFGVPVDLLIGWALLWGAVPLLALRRRLLGISVVAAVLVDVSVMPLLEPVVILGEHWLLGEAVAVTVCLVPGLLLGSWTAANTRLAGRAVLQILLTGGLVFWWAPSAALARPDGIAGLLLDLPAPAAAAVGTVLAMACCLGVAAVHEFVERGGGTPLPYDPPVRLVRSGPYAYCRNPMQTSIVVVLATMAAATANLRLAGAAAVALAYGAGLAVWHEEQELPARFGWAWTQYRVAVPAWRLRRRPALSGPQATIWVGASCRQCAPVADFLRARRPVRLDVRAAEEHPDGNLRRITYEVEGHRFQGVAAIARAVEHLHIGWAFAGWALRLPVIAAVVQVAVDAAGGGPRSLPARPPAGLISPRCAPRPDEPSSPRRARASR